MSAATARGASAISRLTRAALAALMVPVIVLSAPPTFAGASETYVVTSTGGSADTNVGDGDCIAIGGGCTLRAAIEEANDDNDLDTITFALGGPATIVASSLPAITEPLTIDGSTNPGANCDYLGDPAQPPVPTVAISGGTLLLSGDADGSTIRNLSIHSSARAIVLTGDANTGGAINFFDDLEDVVVECSWLGLKLDGTPGSGQTGNGIDILSINFGQVSDVRIGSLVGDAGNVIGGFAGTGIFNEALEGPDLLSNRIGVRPDGSPAGNGGDGVFRPGRTSFNLIAHSGEDGLVHASPTPLQQQGNSELISGNTIRDNGGFGVSVEPNHPNRGRIQLETNSIFGNGDLGIRNNGPNSPEVTITSLDGTDLTMRLRVESFDVGSPTDVELFWNVECDPSGLGEGQTYRETFIVTPNAEESFIDLTMATTLPAGQFLSLTSAKQSSGHTSEFSNCVSENDRFVVDIETNDGDVSPGDGVCLGAFGGCSLRAALEEVNALGGAETEEIVFDLPAGTSIAVSGSSLPPIAVPVSIDGTLNAGASCGNASGPPSGLIQIQAAPGVGVGLEFTGPASGSTLRGLEITGASVDGVLVDADDMVLECNIFGSLSSGGNIQDGIDVRGDDNIVGGSFSNQGNLIVNNQLAGVRIAGLAQFNQVSSNWIGTDGSTSAANDVGVEIDGSATNNSIGSFGQSDGSTPGGNVIGGNTNHGVNVLGSGFTNFVTGNWVGVLEDGSAMANGRHGIRTEADNVLIGRGRGAFSQFFSDPNVVGHNGDSGMALFGDDVFALGNFVGVMPDGSADIGNDDHGIFLGGSNGLIQENAIGNNGADGIVLNGAVNEVEGNFIGVEADGLTAAGNGERGMDVFTDNNSIGGSTATDGNLIANNQLAGIRFASSAELTTVRLNTIRNNVGDGIEVTGTATRNRFYQNSISANGGFGIDLGGDGIVNPNDEDDPDTGPNDFLNRVEITGVDLANTLIDFKFQGTPNLVHQVEFSASLSCDASGAGEGMRPIDGLFGFTTDSNGDFNGVFDAQGGFAAGEVLTALVTSTSFGGVYTTTSEYSDCVTVPGVNSTDTDGDGIFDVFELNEDTDGDGLLNRLDADDDGDGRPTEVENVDNFNTGSGNTANALNSDGLGPVDYLDPAALFRLLDPACRVLQTGSVNGGDSIDFSVSGGSALAATSDPNACVVPASATAVLANVIVVDPVAGGNLRLTAAGTTPLGGVVNFSSNGLNNTNATSVPVSASGELNVSVNIGAGNTAAAAAGIEVEILGYYEVAETPSLVLQTLTPCAVFDTRTTQGGSGPITADALIGVDVVGSFPASQGGGNTNCGVVAEAEAVLVNVVAVGTSGPVDVTSTITGVTVVSNQTHSPGMNNSSAVVLPVTAAGEVVLDVDVSGSSELRLVVLGQYLPTMIGTAASPGLEFRPLVPCAAFDTRTGTGGFEAQRSNGQATDYDVVGSFNAAQGGGNSDCGVPASAEAVELNLVAVAALTGGNLRVAETGVTPSGGVLNFGNLIPSMNNSNALVVNVSSGGSLTVSVNAGATPPNDKVTHVRGVVSGYYVFQFDDS